MMVGKGIDPAYASKLIQYGWETITEALKHGGITGMMDRLDNPSKIKCFELAALLKWRAATAETGFEKTPAGTMDIPEQEYFDNAIVMVAMCKAGVELAFEEMVAVGLKPESAYYESLHETPLIANTIARMKLHEMNSVISDTAEYGCYLYSQACEPLLKDFMAKVDVDVIGKKYSGSDNGVDNRQLNAVNEATRSHPVEIIGQELRGYMTDMEKIVTNPQ